jgi:hypothetical protein
MSSGVPIGVGMHAYPGLPQATLLQTRPKRGKKRLGVSVRTTCSIDMCP